MNLSPMTASLELVGHLNPRAEPGHASLHWPSERFVRLASASVGAILFSS